MTIDKTGEKDTAIESKLSVIICTYNPTRHILSKCLEAITLACKVYKPEEIILIDNNSDKQLSQEEYIQTFLQNTSYAKVIIERQQGLTPARLRGIKEAVGNLLVFIDDDNFIRDDFFLKGMQISKQQMHIGAWSGQVALLFEKEPEAWTKKYWGLLVHRKFEGNLWSNFPHLAETMPCGAGLFIRRSVAAHYQHLHETGKRAIQLDRTKNSLFSGGDNDLAACACDIGLGVGLFDELLIDHYIPASRLTKEYLLKLAAGIAASAIVFKSFRNEYPALPSLKNKWANLLRLMLKSPLDRSFFKAVLKGTDEGRKIVLSQLQK